MVYYEVSAVGLPQCLAIAYNSSDKHAQPKNKFNVAHLALCQNIFSDSLAHMLLCPVTKKTMATLMTAHALVQIPL